MSEERRDVLTGTYFVIGDVAAAEGAIAAGCRFFAGYPITPSSELAEHMAVRLPEVGGVYIQMEDELGSMAALVGASYAGAKPMTATSGPGFSLMQENIGLAAMLEAPVVVVNVMRGGPSTGQPTKPGQQDVMQAKWGSHGDYEIIALAPSTVQECFDFTIEAFNYAEQYRTPVIVLMDEILGHTREKLVIPEPDQIRVVNRKRPKVPPEEYKPFEPEEDLVPPMAILGEGYRFYATGLTHNEQGFPRTDDPYEQEKLVRRLCDKIRRNKEKIVRVEEYMLEDADVAVIAFGSVARAAKAAVKLARKKGIRAGLLRLKTIWPFPEHIIERLAESVKSFVVAELNYGQIVREVERRVDYRRITFLPKFGEALHTPHEILEGIVRSVRGGKP